MRTDELATKADIDNIIEEIRLLQESIRAGPAEKKYLRSADVRKMLNISDSKLQRMRISKTLNAKKIDGTWFYTIEDIQKLMK